MGRKSHRPPSSRDVWRPSTEGSEHVHERRGRSRSRERHRSPHPSSSRRRPLKAWRDSREGDASKDYDKSATSSRRERDHSAESKRSARHHSVSPIRGRNEKDAPKDLKDSQHRHSHKRHRETSPPPKRRRSRSPPISDSTKNPRRARSPPPIRKSSPHKHERLVRDRSGSPRRASSPRGSRKLEARTTAHAPERLSSPGRNNRKRSLSPARSPSRKYHASGSAVTGAAKLLPDISRRRSPPRKRRTSPRESVLASPKRRKLSPSPPPRHDSQSKATSLEQRISKDKELDRGKSANALRNSEKELLPDFKSKAQQQVQPDSKSDSLTSRKIVKGFKPIGTVESKVVVNEHKTPTSPLRPIPSFETAESDSEQQPEKTTNSYAAGGETSDIPQSELDGSSTPFKNTPPTGPYVNPERAARNIQGYGGRGRGWSRGGFQGQGNHYQYAQSSFSTGANATPQGPPSGPSHFNQQHSSFGQHHSSYQPNYRSRGFHQNGFAPVVEHDRRFGGRGGHSFQLQGPPSQPRGRGINIYMGGRGNAARGGRFDQPRSQMPPPPPPPPPTHDIPPPPPEDNPPESEEDPDDNPFRPTSFRVQDEDEDEEQAKQESPERPLTPTRPKDPEVQRPQSRQLNDAAQMPPPARPAAHISHKRGRFDPQPQTSSPAANPGQGFRPFSINLSKSRSNPRLVDPLARNRGSTNQKPYANDTTNKTPTTPTGPSGGASSGASKVVEALKAAAANKDRIHTAQTPGTSIRQLSFDPNDPYRYSVYERVTMVGEGTYGKVYKARNRNTRELVALKRIRMESERDGFPITAVREMKLLQSLKHDNIVSLLETMVERSPNKPHSDFYMVFEYMDHDLTGILHHPTFKLEPGHIKHLARQFFQGLEYLHHRGVLHRDIKASNILLNSEGLLKLADFGLARFYQKRKRRLDYSNRIITLWYRPPEILLGETAYGPAVDIWSAGCVFVELFTRNAVFPGQSEIDQLDVIYELLGTPTKDQWPNLPKMPWYELLKPPRRKESKFDNKYRDLLPSYALELVKSIFAFDPDKRPTATEVLQHQYFTDESVPAKPCTLHHLHGDWHEFEAKSLRKRRERAAKQEKEASRRSGSGGGSVGQHGSGGSTILPHQPHPEIAHASSVDMQSMEIDVEQE